MAVTFKPRMPEGMKERTRALRRTGTDAERAMWKILRNRGLANAKFRRQHPIGGYVLDFYCVEARLAVELDGAGHNEPTAARQDSDRSRILEEQHGIRVIRFRNAGILAHPDQSLRRIEANLKERMGASEAHDAGA